LRQPQTYIRDGARRLNMSLPREPGGEQPTLPNQVRTQFVAAWIRAVVHGDSEPEVEPFLSSLNGPERTRLEPELVSIHRAFRQSLQARPPERQTTTVSLPGSGPEACKPAKVADLPDSRMADRPTGEGGSKLATGPEPTGGYDPDGERRVVLPRTV